MNLVHEPGTCTHGDVAVATGTAEAAAMLFLGWPDAKCASKLYARVKVHSHTSHTLLSCAFVMRHSLVCAACAVCHAP